MPRVISQEKRQRCIHLRIQQQLSTPAIARSVGISNYSAYRVLEGYPWLPVGKRRSNHGKQWSKDDEDVLRRLYPTAEQTDLAVALPGRSWLCISKQANKLKIRRRLPGSRRNKRFIHPICIQLRERREALHLERPVVAARCGYHVNQILAWELGKTWPKLQCVTEWAKALDAELSLCLKGDQPLLIAPPRKNAMMAGR